MRTTWCSSALAILARSRPARDRRPRGAEARALQRVPPMIVTHPILRAALAVCVLAACHPQSTLDDDGGDPAGGGSSAAPAAAVSAPVDAGRYSAHVFGRGTAA